MIDGMKAGMIDGTKDGMMDGGTRAMSDGMKEGDTLGMSERASGMRRGRSAGVRRTLGALLTLGAIAVGSFADPAAASAQTATAPYATAPDARQALASIQDAAESITAADLEWRVGVIAHDSMMGRDTPSPGLDRTAEWAASEFRRFGLRGGAEDGRFIQRYPLSSETVDVSGSGLAVAGSRLAFGDDLLPLFGAEGGESTGDVVLLSGRGDLGWLARRAVRGKHVIVVLAANAPGVDQSLFRMLGAIRNAGAASVMVTNSTDDDRWAAQRDRSMRPTVAKGWGDTPGPAGVAPMLQIRTASLTRLLAGRDVDLSGLQARWRDRIRIDDLDDVDGTLTIRTRTSRIEAPNVVAILDGSDPALADEFVVYSAHIDGVGTGTPDVYGDSIFNGADDDASGTAAILEVAEAMASLETAPRRSMLFLLVSGEEKGLWGSEWFAEHPTVPLPSMVANLNSDMVGRNWTDTIVAIGKEHSDLGETLERVNRAHSELGMTAIDDLWPDERFYFRSDHYNFARKGVPVLFFFNGTHEDYHGRGDEVERIDAEKAARIARLVYYLGIEVGNADERPQWNPESYRRIVSQP